MSFFGLLMDMAGDFRWGGSVGGEGGVDGLGPFEE